MKLCWLSCCVLLSGCSLLPSFVVGKKSVPAPVVKAASLVEVEKQTARLIADHIETPVELIKPARELSNSLGQPDKPLDDKNLPKAANTVVEKIVKENTQLHREVAKQTKFLSTYAGHKIEDTGFDIGGLLSGTGVLGVIALVIFVPGALTILLTIIHRLRATLTHVVTAVEQYRVENPKAVEGLEDWARERMDQVNKTIIDKVRAKVDPAAIVEAKNFVAKQTT